MLKDVQDEFMVTEPYRVRNLAAVHFSCPDPTGMPVLMAEIEELLKPKAVAVPEPVVEDKPFSQFL